MIKNIDTAVRSYLKNISYSFGKVSYSNVLYVSDGFNWSLNWDSKELINISKKLGIQSRYSGPLPFFLPNQAIFFLSRKFLKQPGRYLIGNSRIAFPYYHGYPDSNYGDFRSVYKNLEKYHGKISRIQVTHSKMQEFVLSTGIDPVKVFQIPIGVNLSYFFEQTLLLKNKYRNKYGIPRNAIVIGSFQKDGNGWNDGNTPKLIKGPDIFLKSLKILKQGISEIFILLSGPARGYVINGLNQLKISYKHFYFDDYRMIGELYNCLDLYMISSRQEGGPKAVLESMASGIPVVTTKVGQAMDIVCHGKNGCLVEVEDYEGLAYWSEKVLSDISLKKDLVRNGLKTAKENTYSAHIPLWKDFFKGFVQLKLE